MSKFSSLISLNRQALNLIKPDEVLLTDEELREKEICESSLYEFGKRAWKISEGSTFVEGWHLQIVSEHLEALYYQDIDDLLINMPFRSGKSMFCSVFFPVWVFIKDPSQSFLCTSYIQFLSSRDSLKCRRLIESEWFQKYWGSHVVLRKDARNKLNFETTAGGYRLSSSVDGGNTGGGANFICFPFETMITTDQGQMPIGRIVEEKIACKVLSFNHETNAHEFKDIEDYIKNPATELLEIEIGDKTIRCTPDHPFYIKDKGYIRADQIKEGDHVKILPEMFQGVQM